MKVKNKFTTIEYDYSYHTWEGTVPNKDCFDVIDWGDLVMGIKIRQDNSKSDMHIYDRHHIIKMIVSSPHRYAFRELTESDWQILKAKVASFPKSNNLEFSSAVQKEQSTRHLMKSQQRIFLCHASEDKATVIEYYHKLRAEGCDPWLDKEDLLPGQNWRQEIPKALKRSQFVIIFFSSFSVSKRGYVQREFKLALDTLQEIPEGQIFIIPVRLDDCEIPDSFQDYHHVDLFENNGFDKVLKSINSQIPQEEKHVEKPIQADIRNLDNQEIYDGPYYAAPAQLPHQKGKWAVFSEGAQLQGTVRETEEEAKDNANSMNRNS